MYKVFLNLKILMKTASFEKYSPPIKPVWIRPWYVGTRLMSLISHTTYQRFSYKVGIPKQNQLFDVPNKIDGFFHPVIGTSKLT